MTDPYLPRAEVFRLHSGAAHAKTARVNARLIGTCVFLNLVVLGLCAEDVRERARKKGRRQRVWGAILVSIWLFVQIVVTAFVVVWFHHFGDTPDLFMIFLPGGFAALVAAIQVGRYLDRQPSLLPPPPAIGFVFKFPCPHCSQRVSASRDMVGTPVNCPSCQRPFLVPSHKPNA